MYQTAARILSFAFLCILLACNQQNKTAGDAANLAAFNADSLKADLAILASDSFLGRKPFTAGETKTIDFLQRRYQEIGLEPGNGDSYLQAVPMVSIEPTAAPLIDVYKRQIINSSRWSITKK